MIILAIISLLISGWCFDSLIKDYIKEKNRNY